MPKESKKFINPLLRPSQEAGLTPSQPQKNLVPEVQPFQTEEMTNEARTSEKPLEKTLPPADLLASLLSTSPSPLPSPLPSTDMSLETVIHEDIQSELSTSKSRLRGKRNVSERTRDNAIAQSGHDISMQASTTNAEPVRRKRGPLAFEKTHERITLWIDKGLKQSFEELAYERELPKTALLNEAIADLLRKYNLR